MQELLLPPGCERRCPGCAHRGWEADPSEAKKQAWLNSELSPHRLEPLRGVRGAARWNYRSKVCLHAEWKQDHWVFGLRVPRPGSWKEFEVIDIPNCPVHSLFIQKLTQVLARELPGPEALPLVFLTVSGTLGTLVIKSKELPRLPVLDWASLGLTGLFVNLNPSAGNRVYAHGGWKLQWGNATALDRGMQYGPECFQQLIPSLHDDSLAETTAFLSPQENDGVVDLCSGLGRSLALWRKQGASCLGVELSGDSIRCLENNLGPGICLRGRVSERLPQMTQWVRSREVSPASSLCQSSSFGSRDGSS